MNVPLNIDWQQILLHLFNFLILAGGLYLLLYKPVKAFMEKRNAYYADLDAAANKKNEDAEAAKKQYQDRLSAAEVEISNMKKKFLLRQMKSAARFWTKQKKKLTLKSRKFLHLQTKRSNPWYRMPLISCLLPRALIP